MGKSDTARFAEANLKKNGFSNQISTEFNRANGEVTEYSFWKSIFQDNKDYKDLSSLQKLPDQSTLPQFIQDFLKHVEDLDDIDKIRAIHNFTLQNVDYIDQSCGQDTLNPDKFFKNEKQYGDCDDFAFYNAALMHYAGIKNVGLVGANIKDTFSNGYTDNGTGHAVAVTKIGDQLYILDQNYVEPIPVKDGKSMKATLLSDEGSKNEGKITGNIEIERIKLFVEFGNNKKIYVWDHPDDDKVFVSTCNETTPTTTPNNTAAKP